MPSLTLGALAPRGAAALRGREDQPLVLGSWRRELSTNYDGKTVFVREYLRERFGKWETVTCHYRSPPNR